MRRWRGFIGILSVNGISKGLTEEWYLLLDGYLVLGDGSDWHPLAHLPVFFYITKLYFRDIIFNNFLRLFCIPI